MFTLYGRARRWALAALAPALLAASGPALTVDPSPAAAGATVTVTATGFGGCAPDDGGELSPGTPTLSADPPLAGLPALAPVAPSSGDFTGSFTAPTVDTDTTYTITAQCPTIVDRRAAIGSGSGISAITQLIVTGVVVTTIPDTSTPEWTPPETLPDSTPPDTTLEFFPPDTLPEFTPPDTLVVSVAPDPLPPDTTVPDTTVPDTTAPSTPAPNTTSPVSTVTRTSVVTAKPPPRTSRSGGTVVPPAAPSSPVGSTTPTPTPTRGPTTTTTPVVTATTGDPTRVATSGPTPDLWWAVLGAAIVAVLVTGGGALRQTRWHPALRGVDVRPAAGRATRPQLHRRAPGHAGVELRVRDDPGIRTSRER